MPPPAPDDADVPADPAADPAAAAAPAADAGAADGPAPKAFDIFRPRGITRLPPQRFAKDSIVRTDAQGPTVARQISDLRAVPASPSADNADPPADGPTALRHLEDGSGPVIERTLQDGRGPSDLRMLVDATGPTLYHVINDAPMPAPLSAPPIASSSLSPLPSPLPAPLLASPATPSISAAAVPPSPATSEITADAAAGPGPGLRVTVSVPPSQAGTAPPAMDAAPDLAGSSLALRLAERMARIRAEQKETLEKLDQLNEDSTRRR